MVSFQNFNILNTTKRFRYCFLDHLKQIVLFHQIFFESKLI